MNLLLLLLLLLIPAQSFSLSSTQNHQIKTTKLALGIIVSSSDLHSQNPRLTECTPT